MAQRDKVKELVGRGLNSYHTKSLQQIDRIEKKNKEQNHKISILSNELDNDYLTKTEEGSVVSLEHSKEGMVYLDEFQGNTLVNYCVDGAKEFTLNDDINEFGTAVKLTETVDDGQVDVLAEGNTMVNVCDQKEAVAITKSYTVETGNHIALQGEFDGKARPVPTGNTLVNLVDGYKDITWTANKWNNYLHSYQLKQPLKPNTYYTIIIDIEDYTFNNPFDVQLIDTNEHTMFKTPVIYKPISGNGRYVYYAQTKENTDTAYVFFTVHNPNTYTGSCKASVILLEGDYTNKPIPDYFEGMQSSFEDKVVTQEMVDSGKELVENLGKYRVDYKVTGKNKFDMSTVKVRHSWQCSYEFLPNGGIKLKPTATSGSAFVRLGNVLLKKGIKYTYKSNPSGNYYATYIWRGDDINKYESINFNDLYFNEDTLVNLGLYVSTTSLDNEAIFYPQIEEGSTATPYEPYKESIKTYYLNSPLLEGDTIEESGGNVYHVHRYGKVVLDGSEDEGWFAREGNVGMYGSSSMNINHEYVNPGDVHENVEFCNSLRTYWWWAAVNTFDTLPDNSIYFSTYSNSNQFRITKKTLTTLADFKAWIQTNPVEYIYKLSSPTYELISQSDTILTDSYVAGHLDFDTAVPVEKVMFTINGAFKPKYLYPSTEYIVQFNSDNIGKINNLILGGAGLVNVDVVKGLNKFKITTPSTINNSVIAIYGIGFNASNIVVTEVTDKDFGYFQGMKSVGELEENEIEILSRKDYITRKMIPYHSQKKPIFNFKDVPSGDEASSSELEPFLKHFNNCGSYDKCNNLFDYYRVSEGYWVNLGVWGITPKDCKEAQNVINKHIGEHEGHKKQILLNEPLRAVGDTKDRFVQIDGKWYVERNTAEVVLDGSDDEKWFKWEFEQFPNGFLWRYELITDACFDRTHRVNVISDNYKYVEYHVHNSSIFNLAVVTSSNGNICIADGKFTTLSDWKNSLKNRPIRVIYHLQQPTYEPVEIAPTLNTYTDVTHITNNSTIPMNMNVKNTGYNAIIKPSTLYTVALDTNKSGTIGMNLGGAKGTTTNNVLKLTTPATLADNSLRLYGKGIKGSKVRLLEGDKTNWIPSHFEGMQSSFEDKLQDDGTYKMEILSNNENLMELYDKPSFRRGTDNSKVKRIDDTIIINGLINNGWESAIFGHSKLLKKNTSYTITITKNKAINVGHGIRIVYLNNNVEIHDSTYLWNGGNTTIYKGEFKTINEDFDDVKFEYMLTWDGNLITQEYNNLVLSDIGINETYTLNKSNKIQFSSIEPLRGVDDVKDRFVFKDNKLMIERNCKEIEVNGSLVWNGYDTSVTPKNPRSYFIIEDCYYTQYNRQAKSDKFALLHSDLDITHFKVHAYQDVETIAWYYVPKAGLETENMQGFKKYMENNPSKLVYPIKEPTYEEIPFELQKIILEGYENGTLFFDTNIPPTSKITYAGETPIVKSVKLNKTEVLNNTNDINDNIIPYLMDMDYRVVCLQLATEEIEGGVSVARLFGGAYEMLKRDILSKRLTREEYGHRLADYFNAGKLTEEQVRELEDLR